uniref:Protein max n=1 Tax=Platynereis dumerilii TaxID=6359 RepID=L0PRP4_PLADU|nr:transcription factor Max [Platynereis dumerilii]
MSDEDRDVDIESDEDDDESGASGGYMTLAEKRAHHNALERKRRDHIKESFHSLRDSVPSLLGEKASRAQILKQATDYITFMSKKNHAHQNDIEDIKRQNGVLEQQVRALERAKAAGTFAAAQSASLDAASSSSKSSGKNYKSESESSDSEPDGKTRRKKLKT